MLGLYEQGMHQEMPLCWLVRIATVRLVDLTGISGHGYTDEVLWNRYSYYPKCYCERHISRQFVSLKPGLQVVHLVESCPDLSNL